MLLFPSCINPRSIGDNVRLDSLARLCGISPDLSQARHAEGSFDRPRARRILACRAANRSRLDAGRQTAVFASWPQHLLPGRQTHADTSKAEQGKSTRGVVRPRNSRSAINSPYCFLTGIHNGETVESRAGEIWSAVQEKSRTEKAVPEQA